MDERPRTGGRVSLGDLRRDESGAVAYRAVLLLPDAELVGEATVDASGAVGFGPFAPAEPPAWLLEVARQVLRTEWRARQGADPAPWPGRITRWRAG
jgi:hypothetical protein